MATLSRYFCGVSASLKRSIRQKIHTALLQWIGQMEEDPGDNVERRKKSYR